MISEESKNIIFHRLSFTKVLIVFQTFFLFNSIIRFVNFLIIYLSINVHSRSNTPLIDNLFLPACSISGCFI